MEVWRKRNTSTYISFPLVSSTGVNIINVSSLDSSYLHWSDLSVPCTFSAMGDEARSVADGVFILGVAAAEIDYPYTYILIKSDIALTQNILIRTNVQDPLNMAYAPDAISIMSAIAKVQIDVTSTLVQVGVMSTSVMRDVTSVLAQVGVFSTSVMRDVTSLAIGVNSLVVSITSMMVAVKSTWSNTIAINTGVLSSAVAVKSTWSNTLAIFVSTASLLSNVTDIDTDLAVAQGDITAILAGTISAAIGIASLLSNVANVDSDIAALNDLSAADVNAEVVDALNVDTYAEPAQGAPGATISLAAMIGYLFKNWRNRKTVTSTAISIYNDAAAVVDQKATHSDDGTTYDRGEIGTGG